MYLFVYNTFPCIATKFLQAKDFEERSVFALSLEFEAQFNIINVYSVSVHKSCIIPKIVNISLLLCLAQLSEHYFG